MSATKGLRSSTVRNRKPLTMKSNEQYCLDFGQDIAPTRCNKCGMIYTIGEDQDEKQHLKYCADFDEGVRWVVKLERPKKYFDDGSRILVITKNEPKPIYDMINKLLKISESEMSAGEDVTKLVNKENRLFLIYVTNTNHIVGYICMEIAESAHELIDYEASRLMCDPIPVDCAILYLWVHPSHRRKHIGTHLVDVARANIKPNKIIYRSKVAVCDPTEMAIPFLNAYLHNRRPIRVYQPY